MKRGDVVKSKSVVDPEDADLSMKLVDKLLAMVNFMFKGAEEDSVNEGYKRLTMEILGLKKADLLPIRKIDRERILKILKKYERRFSKKYCL